MSLWVAIAIGVSVLVFLGLGIPVFVLVRRLARREPYSAFLRLRARQKARFFRRLLLDPRVPRRAKLIPLLLFLYLALPFDLVPDFIPVLGYLDDVFLVVLALVLFVRLCPSKVATELLRECATE